MTKRDILSSLDGEERILISRVMDLSERCTSHGIITYTPFLNPREQSLVRSYCKGNFCIKSWGGYDEAERAMLAFCPDESDEAYYPFSPLQITSSDGRVFSHRDYLGAILGLGIKREKIGDIITDEDCAFVFCDDSVSEFVCLNLTGVSSSNVSCTPATDGRIFSYRRRYEERSVTVASLRLDCIVASATGLSRDKSTALIERGLVSHNYDIAKSPSVKVADGDVISARGYGKMKIETDHLTSRKGRTIVCLKYFV